MGEEQTVKAFIERWGNSGAAERANCQSFLSELCVLRTAPVKELARTFTRARTDRVADLLETLAALGQARRMDDGRYLVG